MFSFGPLGKVSLSTLNRWLLARSAGPVTLGGYELRTKDNLWTDEVFLHLFLRAVGLLLKVKDMDQKGHCFRQVWAQFWSEGSFFEVKLCIVVELAIIARVCPCHFLLRIIRHWFVIRCMTQSLDYAVIIALMMLQKDQDNNNEERYHLICSSFMFYNFTRKCISQFQQCPSPPGQPRGISQCCPSRGWGIFVPRVDPWAFEMWFGNRVVSRVFVMEAFIGQDVNYVAD